MIRRVELCTCPNCKSHATVLTIKTPTTTLREIRCSKMECAVTTGCVDRPLHYVQRMWNCGIGLRRNGAHFVDKGRKRQPIWQVVDA